MPTTSGTPLDRYLAVKGPLPPPRVARIALEILGQRSEEFAPADSGRPSVMRPSRVALAEDGSVLIKAEPPLADARSAIRQSPAHVSPEEARGALGDHRSQFYSLGCTLFELVAGTAPYGGASVRDTLIAQVRAPIPDPQEHSLAIDEEFATLIRRLLVKDPARRLSDARELTRSLKRVLVRLRTTGAADGPPQPADSHLRRRARRQSPALEGVSGSRRAPIPRRASGSSRGASRSRRAGPHETPRRGPPGRSRRAHPAGRKRPAYDRRDEVDDEPEEALATARSGVGARPFTWSGLAIGALISVVVVVNMVRSAREVPAEEARVRGEKSRRVLEERKAAFAKRKETDAEDLRELLARSKKVAARSDLTADDRRGIIEKLVGDACGKPGALALAAEYVRLGPPEEPSHPPLSASGGDVAFEKARREVEQLRETDHLWEALEKIRDLDVRHGDHHRAEVASLRSDVERELERRWRGDKERYDTLRLKDRHREAAQIMEKALVYGSPEIRDEARRLLELARADATPAGGEEPAKPGAENDGFGDLDAQFQEEGTGDTKADSAESEKSGKDFELDPEDL